MSQTYPDHTPSTPAEPNHVLTEAVKTFIAMDALCASISAKAGTTETEKQILGAALHCQDEAYWAVDEAPVQSAEDIKLLAGFVLFLVHRKEGDDDIAYMAFKLGSAIQERTKIAAA